jgi:hypothetical protein
VRRHRQRKKWAQVNGGSWQKFAAFCGRPTCRLVPALRTGGLRKGPGKKCRSGIKRPCRMGGRSLKKRRTEFNVAQGNPKGRTCEERQQSQPECNSGIRRLSKTPGDVMRGWTGKLDQ